MNAVILMLLVGLVLGFGGGIFVGYAIGRVSVSPAKKAESQPKSSLLEKQAEEKTRNLQNALALFDDQDKVTNDHVENLLGVSNATAERYLEELERQGLIRQVGEIGRGVHYEKKIN